MTNTEGRLLPTGTCWCGCGEEIGRGSFFAQGHDKKAEAALLAARYGGEVAQLIAHHGFGPDKSVLEAAVESGKWERCSAPGCDFVGTKVNINTHRKTQH